MNKVKVPYHRHNLGGRELKSLRKTFESGFLTGGPRIGEFEEVLSKFLDYPEATVIGVNSGTNALHLALLAAGIKKGDKVITTPLSFVATANAILYAGATPVFVDVDSKTGLIDLDQVKKKLKTAKAILPVHLYGQMVDMKRLRSMAGGRPVIEDSAHCVEGSRDDIKPGQLGDAACFSFHALKTITSGDGGAIVTRDPGKSQLLKILRSHGIAKSAIERQRDYSVQQMTDLGYKYNLSDVQAALLMPQISQLRKWRDCREKIAKRYREAFRNEAGIKLLKTEPGVISSHIQFIILVDPRKRLEIVKEIRARGVEVIASYYPIHLMPYYRQQFGYREGQYPNAEKIGLSTIALPIYPSLTKKEQECVIKTVLGVVRKR